MDKYTAEMSHNETTIRRLSKTQYDTFGTRNKVILIIICCVLFYFGLFGNSDGVVQIACLMAACFSIVSLNMPAKRNAEKTIKQLKGRDLKTRYSFGETAFSFGETDADDDALTTKEYTSIIRLVEEGPYFYLFVSRLGAYMIDKSTIRPSNVEGFKAFVQNAAGLEWTRPGGIGSLSIKKVVHNIKNTRRQQGTQTKQDKQS